MYINMVWKNIRWYHTNFTSFCKEKRKNRKRKKCKNEEYVEIDINIDKIIINGSKL